MIYGVRSMIYLPRKYNILLCNIGSTKTKKPRDCRTPIYTRYLL